MGKDVIVGVVDNYDWDKIKYWANSIKQSGFDGHKALIVYNMNVATTNKLTEEGFMLIGANKYDDTKGFVYDAPGRSIMVDRFFFIYNFLKMLEKSEEVERVIVTDVRDVVFQNNPTDWLNDYFLPQYNLVVGTENMLYKDEPWGRNNLSKSFGEYFYEALKDDPIICAGVLGGTYEDIKDLCLTIWLITRNMNPHVEGGGGPDQAALNILLDNVVHRYTTLFTNPSSGWVVHAGTTMDAIKAGSGGIGEAYLRDNNISLPFIDNLQYTVGEGKIYIYDKALTIVHQWDRVPLWKALVEEKYGD
jgi:hypothetical protein